MPQGENFWNPYRMVPVRNSTPVRDGTASHHRMSGLSGVIACQIEALTCLLVGQKEFVRRKNDPIIPGTSLKGMFRALAELVGNGCSIIGDPDSSHEACNNHRSLCITCRMFGFLQSSEVMAGHVSFSDAIMTKSPVPPHQWERKERILLAQPRSHHTAFYPRDRRVRKIYHHQPTQKTAPKAAPPGVGSPSMFRTVSSAPAETLFQFEVTFTNLQAEELSLLLYCLFLEDGMVHKIGGCKPLGAGSSKITPLWMKLQTDSAARYTQKVAETLHLEGDAFQAMIVSRTQQWRDDNSQTMQALRCLMNFDPDDAREFRYPDDKWFNTHSTVPLKS